MATTLEGKHFSRRAETVFHPIVAEDKTAMAAMRAIVEPNKDTYKELLRACRSTASWSTWLFRRA